MKIFRNWTILHWLSLISLIIGLGILILFIYKVSQYYSISTSESGINISDTASIATFIGGAVGTIWTLVSIFLFYLNLQKQTEAINLQQDQLYITKEQINRQQFENTFFNLLRTQQEIRNSIFYRKDNESYDASNFFEFVKTKITGTYEQLDQMSIDESVNIDRQGNSGQLNTEQLEEGLKLLTENYKQKGKCKNMSKLDKAKQSYSSAFEKYHNQLGHYFRNLYHILKFVHDNYEIEIASHNTIDQELQKKIKDKYKGYVNFVQAQMSSSELLVLFYNGLCFIEMKKLLHTFDFLENLAKEDLIEIEHEKFYDDSKIDGIEYPKIILKSRNNIQN